MAAHSAHRAGRFLLVGQSDEIEELAARLADLGHVVVRVAASDDGEHDVALAALAAAADAILVGWNGQVIDDRRLADIQRTQLPLAWVCARSLAATLAPWSTDVSVLALPLSRIEIAGHAQALLERKRQLMAHTEARKLREMFIAMVAHDLKNPLATVVGNAEYLSQAPELSHESRESVTDLLASASLLGRVLTELVDTGRGLDGPLEPTLVPVAVETFLRDRARAWLPRASLSGVAIAVDCDLGPDKDAGMAMDPDLVRRVLETLLDNALKHAPSGTTVTLAARQRAGFLRLEVRDEGQPIPTSELATLFDRAAVFDHSTSGGAPRSVRRLAALFCLLVTEAHGGRIWVESNENGVTFCLELRQG
jgi:two-component system, sensor histidine kinase and response regulator